MFGRPRTIEALKSLETRSVCLRCLKKLQREQIRYLHTSATKKHSAGVVGVGSRRTIGERQYFWPNGALKELLRSSGNASWASVARQQSTAPIESTTTSATKLAASGLSASVEHPIEGTNSPAASDPLPHRRRRRKRDDENVPLPLDASNRLTTAASALPSRSIRRLLTTYLSLSKPRLTFLIVLTTTSAYTLYPVPAILTSTATAAPSLSTLTLLFLTTGTFLTSASANTLNMLLEPQHDAKMSRTRNRPLVRGLVSKRAAAIFAAATAALGTAALWLGVNHTTALLGAANIALYAFVYTPLKRLSVANTWVGAVVGAVPPLMGWTAAAGQVLAVPLDPEMPLLQRAWEESRELLFGEASPGGWLLAALLFCWQFPHFNALSWPIREEYRNAGYRMLCWVNPARNARVALRYSVLMIPVCVGLSYYGITEPAFIPASLAVNTWVCYEAVRFWRYEGHKGSARGLFWASVWHLPLVLVLAMVLKKGLWERTWKALGFKEEWEGEEWDEEEEFEVVKGDWGERAS